MGFKGDVVQLYPNIAENVYGYIVTLLDDTGAPLANKQVYCTTNAVTYNTNASGVITDVVYSTNASAIVTFELTNQPWADGTYRLNWTISGKTPGVIQSVSSTASKSYDGCAYTITFRNYDNNLWTNNSVYCTTNGKTYYTNASGQATFITSQSSLTFKVTTSQSYSVDNGLRITTQYDVIGSTTGTSGSLVTRSVTGTLQNPTIVSYNVNATATVGNTVTIGSKEYIIAHDDGTNIYAILRYWEEDCSYSDQYNHTQYAGSDIANKCTDWYNNQVPAIWKTANVFNQVETEGVTAACFIPAVLQAKGDWSYFNSDSRRIFYDSGGTAHSWWTSSPTGGLYYSAHIIHRYGVGSSEDVIEDCGFRPALAIKRSAFLNG